MKKNTVLSSNEHGNVLLCILDNKSEVKASPVPIIILSNFGNVIKLIFCSLSITLKTQVKLSTPNSIISILDIITV